VFDDVNLSFWVGNVALAVILLDGGLRIDFATFRTGLRPAMLLATVGVALAGPQAPLAALWQTLWWLGSLGQLWATLWVLGRWLAPPAPGETADALLGPALEVVTSEMDTLWKKLYQQRWAALHAEAQAARQQAADLDARVAAGETLSVAEALRRAELTAARDAAITQFRAICAASPDNAKASLGLATRLLEGDDESGCALAEQAMRLDPELSLEACLLLRDYYWRQGNVALAREWEHRTATRADVEQRASNERATVSLSDHFERNDLPPEALAALVAQLKAVPGLHHAYLVKKRVEVLAQRSCYILGVEVTRWYHLPSRTRVPAVLAAIQKQVNLPQHTLVMPVDGDNYRFGRKFYWMKGARIM